MNCKKFNRQNLKKFRKPSEIIKTEIVKPTPISVHDVIFDIGHIKNLLYRDDFLNTVPKYINKFFFRFGNFIFFDNGETFELLNNEQAKKKIPIDFKRTSIVNGKEKELSLRLYFDYELFLKTPETKLTIDYSKDYKFIDSVYIKGFEVKYNFLNMKKDLPRDYNKVIQLTEENQKGVKMFFDHIKNIICSNDYTEYETVIKFFASSCVGHKLKFCLLWQSKEQTGKGTVLNFMNDLLGKRMVKSSSVENVEKYTKIFEGCSLVNLDELPISGTSKTLQDAMKALITEPEFDCRQMFNNSYSQKNTFNFVITSNNNCISLTQTNQIRYYVNTINDKYIGNKKYFDDLYKHINNEDVKILIYQEFVKIYNEKVKPYNWIGNDLKPTEAGKIKRIEALPPFFKWIKEKYLSKGHGIDCKCSDFLNYYLDQNKNDKSTTNKLARFMQDIGTKIKEIKKTVDGKQIRECRKYIISFEELKTEYLKRGWFDDLIDEIPESTSTINENQNDDDDNEENNECNNELKLLKEELILLRLFRSSNEALFNKFKSTVIDETIKKQSIKKDDEESDEESDDEIIEEIIEPSKQDYDDLDKLL